MNVGWRSKVFWIWEDLMENFRGHIKIFSKKKLQT